MRTLFVRLVGWRGVTAWQGRRIMCMRGELLRVDEMISAITGERFHTGTSIPGDGQTRVVFADDRVCQGYRAGVEYAERMLAYVRANGAAEGWKYAIERGDA